MRTLYYTVTKQLENIAGFEETNGLKDVIVYTIEDNRMLILFELQMHNEDNSEEEILDIIEDEEVELILL
jgi:hypothetical protein